MPPESSVVLIGHGSPESPDQMEAFLNRIRKPSPAFLEEMKRRYRLIGRSPLLDITKAQATALQESLATPVHVGMLYWDPPVPSVSGRVVALPLTPFGGPYGQEKYFKALPDAVRAPAWADEPRLVRAWVGHIAEALEDRTILFTAHSVPVECGPYADQVRALAGAIVEILGDVPWKLAWQSRSPVPGDWLEPDVDAVLKELAGERVLVVPIGFLSDHVEVLYDLDILHKATADRLGIDWRRARMLNDAPMLIDAMATVVRSVK